MRNKYIVLSFSILLALCAAFGKATSEVVDLPAGVGCGHLQDKFAKLMDRKSVSEGDLTLNYRQYTPKNVSGKRPIVVFLHGLGETDGLKPTNEGPINYGAAYAFFNKNYYKKYPCIFIAPQSPKMHTWHQGYSAKFNGHHGGTATWGNYDISDTPADSGSFGRQIRLVKAAIDDAIAKDRGDPDRVYITGLSMGGFATWNLAVHYPDFFACAAPLCGGGDTKKSAARLKNLPIWCFHGDADKSINVRTTRELFQAIKAAGGEKIRYTEYKGAGHNVWDGTYSRDDFWQWMFQQKRPPARKAAK